MTAPSPPVAATPAPTASPSPAYADTLTIGWNPKLDPDGWPYAEYGFRVATDAAQTGSHQVTLASVVYSGLYRYDATFNAVPDLADGPCLPQGDGTVLRCRIIDATFHDETPLTADDVAYSYNLLQRPAFQYDIWYTDTFKEARVVDPRTVDIVLTSVDPTFLTEKLPWVPILPRHVVEAAYAKFVADTKDLKAADLTKLADAIDTDLGKDPPVCTTHLDAVAPLLAKVGYPFYREDFSRTGTFDACAYMGTVSGYLGGTAANLGGTGIDAVANSYWDLPIAQRPIGTGPYWLVSKGPDRIHLEAFAGYRGGVAATRYLDFVPAKGDGSDLLDGTLDVYQLGGRATLGPAFEASAPGHGVRVAKPAGWGYEALQLNVRPGRLFADVNLRRALQLCIDLPRDVAAATGGTGTPAYGPVAASSWAYDPTLPKPPARDITAARNLIEGAGWRPGTDGIYAKDGVRLAAVVVVRADNSPRTKMLDLVSLQARDCGMDISSRPLGWDVIQNDFFQYPYIVPGTGKPFDLYIGSWGGATDPADVFEVLASSSNNDATKTYGDNYVGFSDPVLDRLLVDAMATYDQDKRTTLYRQAQQEVAAQLPYIFLWEFGTYEVVRAAVSTVDGRLDLTTPNWSWQPERLVVAAAGP